MTAKKTILIIDDDSRNIFALSAVLKAKGYQTIAASSAQEGIKILLNDKSIQAVLMDIMMPDMDGYEAIAQIRWFICNSGYRTSNGWRQRENDRSRS